MAVIYGTDQRTNSLRLCGFEDISISTVFFGCNFGGDSYKLKNQFASYPAGWKTSYAYHHMNRLILLRRTLGNGCNQISGGIKEVPVLHLMKSAILIFLTGLIGLAPGDALMAQGAQAERDALLTSPLLSTIPSGPIELWRELRVPESREIEPIRKGFDANREAQKLNDLFNFRRGHQRAGEFFTPEEAEVAAREVEKYIEDNPGSPYTPGLRVEVGKYYRANGRISLSLTHFQEAFQVCSAFPDGEARRLADESLAYLGTQFASLGRTEDLKLLINANRERIFTAPHLAQLWRRTREAYRTMVQRPWLAFRCGPIALFNVAKVLNGTTFGDLVETASPSTGFTLAELGDLANQRGIGLRTGFREAGSVLPVPSVVHWKANHYAAILAESDGRYLIEDPTFRQSAWIRAADIEEEASGYFLIPNRTLPLGWRAVEATEASAVFGKGYPMGPCDDCPEPCEECCEEGGGGGGTGSSTNECGMATWTISEPTINLQVKDIPMMYKAAFGPDFVLGLKWRQRWASSPPVHHSHFDGPWGSDLLSYVDGYQGYNSGSGVALFKLYRGDGSITQFEFASGNNTSTDYASGVWVVRTVSGSQVTGLTVYFRNGSSEGYNLIYGGHDYQQAYRQDATGKRLDFEYTDGGLGSGYSRLKKVYTADDQTFAFGYEDPNDVMRITKVTGPDNRLCSFGYTGYDVDGDTVTDVTVLTSITDAVGLVSSFQYDSSSWWIDQITTPYGTTTFDHWDAGICTLHDFDCPGVDRYVVVTEPTSDKQVYLFYDNQYSMGYGINAFVGKIPTAFSASQIPVYAAGTPPVQTLDTVRNERNSHHWNRQQTAALSTSNPANFNAADFLISRTKHWGFHSFTRLSTALTYLGPLHWVLPPSLDGATEQQPTFYDYAGKDPGLANTYTGTNSLRSVEARRLLNSTNTHFVYFARNNRQMITQRVEGWQDSLGIQQRTNTYTYASGTGDQTIDGLLKIQEIDPLGNLVFGYKLHPTYVDQIQFKTNSVGDVTQYDYDSNRRVTAITNHAGMKSAFSYDVSNYRLSKVIDSIAGTAIRTNTYTWLNGYLRTHSNPYAMTRTFDYDYLGRLTRVTYPDATTDENFYILPAVTGFNTSGSPLPVLDRIALKDRDGRYWYTLPNRLRQIATIIEPSKATGVAGTETTLSYCGCGSPSTIITASNTGTPETIGTTFNWGGLPVVSTLPDNTKATNLYDGLGRQYAVLDQYRKLTNYFDGLGRIVEKRDAVGIYSGLEFDKSDRVLVHTNRNGVKWILTYDAGDRIRSRTQPDGGVEAWGYTSGFPEATSYTNGVSDVTIWKYDAAGRQTNEIASGVYTNVYTYNGFDSVVGLKDGKGQNTTWEYDVYNRVYRKYDTLNTNVLQYLYSSSGLLTNRWSKQKGEAKYQYDAARNLTNVTYATSAPLQFVYDAHNRATKDITAGVFTNVYTFKPGGLLESEDSPQWANSKVTLAYTSGLRTSLTLQQPTIGNWSHSYSYDSARRLLSIGGSSGTFTHAYTPAASGSFASSLVQGIAIPTSPGSIITNWFDSTGRMRSTVLRGASTTFNSHTYNIIDQANQLTRQRRPDSTLVDYTYDDAGQVLTALSYNSTHSLPISTEQFKYGIDAAQNIVQFTNNAAVTTYSVNSLNQVTGDGTFTYTYDWNGNRVSKSAGTVYTFDDENQLTTVTYQPSSGPGYRTTITYDARGRMRQRAEESWTSGGGFVPVTATRYIYDGKRVIQERSASNVPTVTYSLGLDLSGRFENAGGIGGKLARTAHSGASGGTYAHAFYHADRAGNISYVLKSDQTLGAQYYYDPFGREISSSGTLAAANSIRFSSKELLAASGLYYYGYRFYDSTTQRWLNRDPLLESGGNNLYCAYDGNPVNTVDTDGRIAIALPLVPIIKAIGIIAINIIAEAVYEGVCEMVNGSDDDSGRAEAEPQTPPPVVDTPASTPPFVGPPGQTVRGGTQSTEYGPDGYPNTQRDLPHPDEKPPGNGDHSHDWTRPPGGGPPIGPPKEPNPYRGPPRSPEPGDPPPPRGPGVPPCTK